MIERQLLLIGYSAVKLLRVCWNNYDLCASFEASFVDAAFMKRYRGVAERLTRSIMYNSMYNSWDYCLWQGVGKCSAGYKFPISVFSPPRHLNT